MSNQVPERAPTPATEVGVRIADADRDRVIAFLRSHCTDGALTLDEFADRVGLVYASTTRGDLEKVTRDLPTLPTASTPAPARRTKRAVRWTMSIFGANQQKGRWRLEERTTAVSFMGGCRLDLRQAEVAGDRVTINAIAVMGGVDVIVPEGIEVVLEGVAIMGSKQGRVRNVPVLPGSPVVRVRAFALMGGVSVQSRRPPGEGRRRDRRDKRVSAPDPRPLEARPGTVLTRGVDAVADEVRDQWPELRHRVAPEGTVTIMFSDIEGFTSLTERLGDFRAQEVLRAHYALVRDELDRHRGFEVKVHGDGFMVAFDSAARAVRCARAIQAAQGAWTAAHPETPVRVRIGIHTGEAIRDADDFLGSTVNLASRIASAARGGEILVSALLRELCASSGEFTFDGGHELELKGLSQPHRVYSVAWS